MTSVLFHFSDPEKAIVFKKRIARKKQKEFMTEAMHSKITIAELDNFLEFLFEKSEHCDHISQTDAWKEYYVHQANN